MARERLETRGSRAGPSAIAGRRSGSFLALFALVVALCLVGLVVVLSASSVSALEDYGTPWYRFVRQAIWLGVGSVGFIIALRTDYQHWRRWTTYVLWIALALLVVVLIPQLNVSAGGAQRWIGIGPFTIQPSEFAKLALVLFMADLLARRSDRLADPRQVLWPVASVFLMMGGLIFAEKDLGTTILLFAIAFAMLFVAGVPGRQLSLVGLAGAAAAALFAVIEPYRLRRLASFTNPEADPEGAGYQSIQSFTALANGGLAGTGVGQGRGKYGYLPEADSDFIFSVIGEEAGFIGAVLVIGLFLALGAVAIRVAVRCEDRYGMLLAAGVTAWFLLQAFVNIGAAVGVMPTTGVPLPFVSSGGSALVISLFAAGILLNVSRHSP